MSNTDQTSDSLDSLVASGDNLPIGGKSSNMGKEERKRMVLGLLVESGLELPPAVIFDNLKRRGATFERRSVDNYLQELQLLQEKYTYIAVIAQIRMTVLI